MKETAPRAWTAYQVYCILKWGFYGAVLYYGMRLRQGGAQFITRPLEEVYGLEGLGPGLGQMFIVSAIPMLIFYGVLPFLPRKPWAYWTHFGAVITGVLMCCFAPLCIPLAIAFRQEQVKEWFGIHKNSPRPPRFEV